MLTEKFDKDNYNTVEIFTTAKKSNSLVVLFLLPVYTIGVCVYLLQQSYANIFAVILNSTFLLEVLILFFGVFFIVVIALLAKAVMLSIFAEGNFKSVKLKIIKEIQRPYCCLTEPIKIWQYQLCIAVSVLISSVMPYILALIIGDFVFVMASFLCMFFACGDILFFISLFGWKKHLNVKKAGSLYVYDFEGIMLYRIYGKIDL